MSNANLFHNLYNVKSIMSVGSESSICYKIRQFVYKFNRLRVNNRANRLKYAKAIKYYSIIISYQIMCYDYL